MALYYSASKESFTCTIFIGKTHKIQEDNIVKMYKLMLISQINAQKR